MLQTTYTGATENMQFTMVRDCLFITNTRLGCSSAAVKSRFYRYTKRSPGTWEIIHLDCRHWGYVGTAQVVL